MILRNKTLYLLYIGIILICVNTSLHAQQFYFGADLSYVNEMEDCGAIYLENGFPEDPYQLFADHDCNLVRLRLWHTPDWYDNLNSGVRYSDFQDVKKSIHRARERGLHVLLDFHLSDNWADPGKQRVPDAWLAVVDNLPVLTDSLYNYISHTLLDLDQEGFLPELVQIGNETNKGILLSPEDDNAGWVLDWDRNSQLFNAAFQAVRDVETQTGKSILSAIHIADPADAAWLVPDFLSHGVTGFDIIGISYYWQYHKPVTIAQTGGIIANLIADFPAYRVMIFETGVIWTTQGTDNANNVLSTVDPSYTPASPENQKQWMIDLTQEVIDRGGSGVIYWEPAWVSSDCYTQWGKGSHYENAAFFDFDNHLIDDGGIGFFQHDYENLSARSPIAVDHGLEISFDSNQRKVVLKFRKSAPDGSYTAMIIDQAGRGIFSKVLEKHGAVPSQQTVDIPVLSHGFYVIAVCKQNTIVAREKVMIQ